MKTIKINDIILTGEFILGLRTGLSKVEIERILEVELKQADIETPDLDLYYVEIKTGLVLTISFDKNNICFDINLDLEENRSLSMNVELGARVEKINESIDFEKLISIIS